MICSPWSFHHNSRMSCHGHHVFRMGPTTRGSATVPGHAGLRELRVRGGRDVFSFFGRLVFDVKPGWIAMVYSCLFIINQYGNIWLLWIYAIHIYIYICRHTHTLRTSNIFQMRRHTHTHLEHHKNQEGDVLSVSFRTWTHINTNMHFDKGKGGLMF